MLAADAGGLPLVAGMTIFAGLVEIGVAFLLNRLRVIFQPILSGLCVFVIGLQLGIVGIGKTLDVAHEGLSTYHLHLIVTVTTLGSCVALSIWGRGALRLLCTLVGLVAGVIAAALFGVIDMHSLEAVRHAAWLTLPGPGNLSFAFMPMEVAGAVLVFTASFMITGGMQIMLSPPAGHQGGVRGRRVPCWRSARACFPAISRTCRIPRRCSPALRWRSASARRSC